jgi:hypothetical protein
MPCTRPEAGEQYTGAPTKPGRFTSPSRCGRRKDTLFGLRIQATFVACRSCAIRAGVRLERGTAGQKGVILWPIRSWTARLDGQEGLSWGLASLGGRCGAWQGLVSARRRDNMGVAPGRLQPVELAELFFIRAHGAAHGLTKKHHQLFQVEDGVVVPPKAGSCICVGPGPWS